MSTVACDNQDSAGTEPISGGDILLVGEIDWSMPDRFGLDANEDGLIDIPNTAEYLLNVAPATCASGCEKLTPVFTVVLDASGVALVDAAGVQQATEAYSWVLTDESGESQQVVSESSKTVVELPEGVQEVVLEVTAGAHRRTTETSIVVGDWLIVSIGDSYASGEGSPEIPGDPARWADAGGATDSPQALDHDVAHRSGLAGSAQAALAIERADPRSSVTYVSLAASGAEIEEGMLSAPGAATGGDGDGHTLRPQVEELADLMGCASGGAGTCLRTIDTLMISAGGNDIGFAFTVGSLIALDPLLVVNPIYQNLLDNLVADVGEDIDALPALFDQLGDALSAIAIDQILLTGYPGSSTVAVDGRIVTCDEIGGDLIPGLEVDQDELNVVREGLLVPLNDTLEAVADAQGWVFVDSHVSAFEGHGYCGSDPYGGQGFSGNPFPEDVAANNDPGVRWFRRAAESAAIQGGGGLLQPERLATSGTFHPNEFGHQAYKTALLEVLDRL